MVYSKDALDRRVFNIPCECLIGDKCICNKCECNKISVDVKCPCQNKECNDKNCPNCKCVAQKMPVGDHESISIPQFLNVKKPGWPQEIEANTTANNVVWFVNDEENATIITRNESGTKAIFFAAEEGTYIIRAVIATLHDGKPVVVKSNTCIVTVGKPTPPKPDPDNPPNPPAPKDDLDAFQTKVYQEYVRLNKPKADLIKLAEYYESAQKIIQDVTVNNTMVLDMALKAEAKNKLGNTLMPIRGLSQEYLKSKLPPAAGILSDMLRQTWTAEFSYLAESMRKVAK